ncbi:MAG: cyclic nucleotide-binding domain-containing protein, partial [bacterium]
RLSTIIRTRDLLNLVVLGETQHFPPGDPIFRKNESSDDLYVVIEGDAFITIGENSGLRSWIGQGDVFGITSFLLGIRRNKSARAGASGCVVWKVPRTTLFHYREPHSYSLLTLLLIALEPIVKIRTAKLAIQHKRKANSLQNYCDHIHPSIRNVADFLRRRDKWETALSVWRFVRNMPYRFGSWNMRASETMRLGYGMCTTKANLQTALMRACEIEAGFTELVVPSKFVSSLLPSGYQPQIGSMIKHYFSVACLDGKWYPCDASFTRESLVLMADANPEVISCIDDAFQRNKPFNPVGEKNGRDPYDFLPMQDIDKVFLKKPQYDDDNFEAMNMKLDRIQNPVFGVPGWVTQAREHLKYNPEFAFQVAFAGIISETYKLYKLLKKRPIPKSRHKRKIAKELMEIK